MDRPHSEYLANHFTHTRVRNEWKMKVRVGLTKNFSTGFWCRAFLFTCQFEWALVGDISVSLFYFFFIENIHLVSAHNQQNSWGASTSTNGRLMLSKTAVRMPEQVIITLWFPFISNGFHLLQSQTTNSVDLWFRYVRSGIVTGNTFSHIIGPGMRFIVSGSAQSHTLTLYTRYIFNLFATRVGVLSSLCAHWFMFDSKMMITTRNA